MRRVVLSMVATAATFAVILSAACSEPPQKEIDRAQGAIDAARAAGADLYAREPFTAATTAMQQTHEAIQQRDYRLALSRATDANERALEAARQAADGKARARSEVEAALGRASMALRQLDERLKAAESSHLTARDMEPARRVRADADRAVQEARAGIEKADYLTASAAIQTVTDRITLETRSLNELIEAKTPRGTRRRR
jgi:hypothetical protein